MAWNWRPFARRRPPVGPETPSAPLDSAGMAEIAAGAARAAPRPLPVIDSAEAGRVGAPTQAWRGILTARRASSPVPLAVAIVTFGSLAAGLAISLADGKFTWLDLLKLCVVLALVLLLGAQAASTIGKSGSLRRLTSRLSPSRSAPAAAEWAAPRLDEADAADLRRIVHERTGVGGSPHPARSGRLLNAAVWFGLLAAVICFVAVGATASGVAAYGDLADGDVGVRTMILAGVAAGGVTAIALLLRVAIVSISDERRRDNQRLLRRLLRYLLRLFDRAALAVSAAGRVAAQVVRTPLGLSLTSVLVAVLAFSPVIAEAINGGDGDGPPSLVEEVSLTVTPTRSRTPTPTASLTPSTTPSSESATLTATPVQGTVTQTPANPPANPPTDGIVLPPPECHLDEGIPDATIDAGQLSPQPDYAAQLLTLTNQYRAGLGIPALQTDGALTAAAADHAQFVIQRMWWETYGGSTDIHCQNADNDQTTRALNYGYPIAVVYENVGWGLGLTAQEIFDFMRSGEDPGIPALVAVGISCYSRPDSGWVACVQVMAEPQFQ